MTKSINNGKLILINSEYELNYNNYEFNLERIPNTNILLDKLALKNLRKVLDEIKGYKDIVAVSGFRPNEEQKSIYEDSLIENGEDFTRKYVALPGHSEHETGLAIDLALNIEEIDFIRPYFPYEGICQEFRTRAVNYGFIERYPKDKEEITKISHEPWHFRYIGYPHSRIVYENNLCLEEYMDFIKKFNKDHPLKYQNYKVWYQNEIESFDNSIEISGNNIDGFIITKK